jgi:Iap family predicted aminopeptidase
MKAIVIVYYKIVKKTIDILHNETIWVKWEIFWKKNHSGLFRAICEIARNS